MRKKFYHKRILPNGNYHKITVDTFLYNHFLLRYTLDNKSVKKGDDNYARHFKASRFWDGLSVNLLSIYHKQDAAFIVQGDTSEPQHASWNEGDEPYSMDNQILKYARYRGFVGIRIKHLLQAKIDKKDIKVNGVIIRKDLVRFKLEHAPTLCNFWHFNIHIEGVNSHTGREYLLREEVGYTNSQLTKVADALVHLIEDYVKPRKYIHAKPLPHKYYKGTP